MSIMELSPPADGPSKRADDERCCTPIDTVGNLGRKANPLQNASILSIMFFSWLYSFFRRGYKKTLTKDDLFGVLPQDSSKVLAYKLKSNWKTEFDMKKVMDRSPSLSKAIIKTFGWNCLGFGFISALEDVVFRIAQSIFLSRLVLYFSTDLISTTEAYFYAAGITLCTAGVLMCHHVSFFGYDRIGMRLRIACSNLIYRKALRLSSSALGETTVGQLVNILSNDVHRFDLAFEVINYLWIAPVQFLLITLLLWREIGVSCLAGISIVVLLIVLQSSTGRLSAKFRYETALLSDARIRIMNEVIFGMRVIKIHAWEASFSRLVSEARRNEIAKIMHSGYLRASAATLFYITPLFVTLCTLWTYAALGNPVVPAKVYAVLPLFYAARLPSLRFLPRAMMAGMEGLVSVRRVKNFLLMEEFHLQDAETSSTTIHIVFEGIPSQVATIDGDRANYEGRSAVNGVDDKPDELVDVAYVIHESGMANVAYEPDIVDTVVKRKNMIDVQNMTGSWTNDSSNLVLKGISFHVQPGELLAVIGPVGSGKSSLLMALLGELPSVTGCHNVHNVQVGYAAQQPWILSGSLKDNILFGSDYCPVRYRNTIRLCALNRDINILPHGDQTLVGERGMTLSGGQRARVGLARAVYSNADVYLLDDPLSAVDPAVSRHLFEKCILKHLQDKPRILVTHQLQYLDQVDTILILQQGNVAGYGTYHELQENGVDFANLLKTESKIDDCGIRDIRDIEKQSKLQTQSAGSRTSVSSCGAEIEVNIPQTVEKEETAVGVVGYNVYLRYFKVSAGITFLLFVAVIAISAQSVQLWTDYWLSQWATAEEEHLIESNQSNSESLEALEFEERSYYINISAILCVAMVIISCLRSFLFFYIFINASKNLHNQMFDAVIRLPMQFFDTNSVGRILNRFAKDTGFVDELLPATLTDVIEFGMLALSTIIIISIFNPFCLAFTAPILIAFVLITKYYLSTSRDVKRLEGNARSPIFAHLSETLTGLCTVRAFGVQQRFIEEFETYQDSHTEAWFMFLASNRWLGVHLDLLSMLFTLCVTFSSIGASDLLGLNSAIVGLSITYAINLTGVFQWAVRQGAQTENEMTSVERICQYIDLKPEAALETDKKPPVDWPQHGQIQLEGASLKYTHDGPDVLKDIHCCINPNEKIGIVGRTGAGKSSLMTILMRLAEPTGKILIDGVDITQIGLHDLRKNISFIPQDPVLFSGTLRKNLDLFGNPSDPDMWAALDKVELKSFVEELPDKLEAAVTEGGTNYSVGQRQLLCLARAILGKNKILIVDEATANVDIRTDRLIQATIRECFVHCTVLTIAHRLNTIMDSDRVMVFDTGRLVEFDEPYILLQNPNGLFTKMVHETGQTEVFKLVQITKDKHLSKQHEKTIQHDLGVHSYM